MPSPAEWAAIVFGVLLIVTGVLWRQLGERRKRRAQTAGLAARAAIPEEFTKPQPHPPAVEAAAEPVPGDIVPAAASDDAPQPPAEPRPEEEGSAEHEPVVAAPNVPPVWEPEPEPLAEKVPEFIEPASPELVASSKPVADAIARALGTKVRSLRITTLEGVVTAQWPR